jgi:hypothetical protein
MIQVVCETCGKVKPVGDFWILGLTSANGEIDIFSGWFELEELAHPLAVHFCSIECKDKYIAKAFVRTLMERAPSDRRPAA